MTREHRFAQVDVFTDRVFGGNPLAVVFDADGLGDAEMQSIAREMNLHIKIAMRGGRISELRVGGGVVPVIEGRLRV